MSDERFRLLFENSLDAIVIADENGRYLDVNQAACELFGYTREQMLRLCVGDLKTLAGASAGEQYQEYLQTGRETGEFAFMRADGSERVASYAACRLAPGQYLSILRDITEQKRSEENLRREKDFITTALESLPGIFYVVDMEGRFLRWNKNLETVTEYAAEEIARLHPSDFFGEEDQPLVAQRIQEVFTQGAATVEAELVTKTGKKIPFFFTGKLASFDDKLCLVGMAVNVTERKRLEAQLVQAQKMEGIGRLAGGVAHDFNNLLSVILGYAELLDMELPDDSPLLLNVHNIQSAAHRAAILTRQLLAFARRQAAEMKVLDLNTLLRDMQPMLTPLIGERIELRMRFQNDLSAVRVDSGQIEQVVVNLVVNAHDAMPEGGTLRIETRNVTLEDAPLRDEVMASGSYALLTISDTGSGMTPDVKAHLFEPFFTTKEVGKGTGLGLATCYGIVKQNRGYIWVYSEVGVGTTVNIYLPLVEGAAEPQTAPSAKNPAPGGGETVLVVEDEPLLRNLAVNALKRNGYHVLEAGNGLEALRIAEDYPGPIHLLLTDLVMPHMGGRELAGLLRQERSQMRVAYVSGYAEEAFANQDISPLEAPLLQKPFSARTLLEMTRTMLKDEG